jgi:hypothetical protein
VLETGREENEMRLTATGWSRDCGATELFDFEVTEARVEEGQFRFRRQEKIVSLEPSPHPSAKGAIRSASVYCHANLRLGGDYKLRLTLSKWEIASLFYLTHKPKIEGFKREMEGFMGAFPAPEPKADDSVS